MSMDPLTNICCLFALLLDIGERKTSEIVSAIRGKRVAIMNELKRLCDAGEIVKVKRGVYDLPSRASPPM